jgi:hypothetical protein
MARNLMASPASRSGEELTLKMLYNFTGGNLPIPTPLQFDPLSGCWHLPEPADFTDHAGRLRVSYERAVAILSLVRARVSGDIPAGHRGWRAA